MSYPFDASQLRVQSEVKTSRSATTRRLLARRLARQTRRAHRAL